MGLNPGEIRIIDPADIAEMFMMTTHNMPLNYLIDQLKEDIGEVIFLGIQPDIVGFYYPMTQPIKDAVETVYQRLEGWKGNGGFAHSGGRRVVRRQHVHVLEFGRAIVTCRRVFTYCEHPCINYYRKINPKM